MKTFAIHCQELPDRKAAAEKHFKERGVIVNWINGIHGETFGLLPSRPYNVDYPGKGQLAAISQVGLMLSHYMVWTVCEQLPDDEFLILEDDACFPEDWKNKLRLALWDLPKDWDIFLIGNSNTQDKPRQQIKGDVWEVKYPFCTHAYMIRKKALGALLTYCRDATLNVDLLLMRAVYPDLKVYTMLPRLVDQTGTFLHP